jgi:protein O-mannosyl-transferase
MTGTPPAAEGSRRTRWLLAAALVAGTLLLYARVLGYPFIWFDDNRYVTENPMVKGGLSAAGTAWAFTTFHVANWHPLTWLSHMLDVELFGLDAGGHHAVNVLLHALNALVLFLALARMTGAAWRSALVAALFAVHPTHVESVAWVAERKDVLSSLLGLLAILAYAGWAGRGGWARYAAVVGCFALSLLAKPMWVTLPFALVLLDVWPLQRWSGSPIPVDPGPPSVPRWPASRLLLEKIPLLALAVASSVVTVLAQASGGAVNSLQLGLGARVANAGVSYLRYLGKTAWPWPLSIFYPHPENGLPGWQGVLAGIGLVAVTFLVIRAAPALPWLSVGWLWFLGTLVPVIGLVQVGGQAMADRYLYLPSIGLFLIVAWGGSWLARRRSALAPARWIAGGLLAALAAVTWVQVGFWKDHVTLFRHAIDSEGPSGTALGVLSEGMRREGRTEEALATAMEAVRLSPTSPRHWINLGISYRGVGRLPEARDALRRAAALDPALPLAWVNLGLVEYDLGHRSEALVALERAAAMGTTAVSAWATLAALRLESGRTEEAGRAFEHALALDPANPASLFNLGLFRLKQGRYPEARRLLEAAARRDPGNPDIQRRLLEARARSSP